MTAAVVPRAGLRRIARRTIRPNGLRVVVAVLIVAIDVAVLAMHEHFRSLEARLATWILSPMVDHQIEPSVDRFFVWASPQHLVSIRVTVECTALLIALPLTLLAIASLVATRIKLWRILTGTAAMWVIVMLTNTIRLGTIGWATQTWGVDPGYKLSHALAGTAIGVVGFMAGALAFFLIIGSARHPNPAGSSPLVRLLSGSGVFLIPPAHEPEDSGRKILDI